MFTGLVEECGTVEAAEISGDRKSGFHLQLTIKAPLVAEDTKLGDSIAVAGCCLTVVKKVRNLLTFEAGSETLERTNLGRLLKGHGVNLERPLKLSDRLGGHLVAGHVDGQGTVVKRRDEGEWSHVTFRAPAKLLRQMVEKGSITVDGVSLTVVSAGQDRFSVALIPHTLKTTTLGQLVIGSHVNLETDLIAKHVQRLLQFEKIDEAAAALTTRDDQ